MKRITLIVATWIALASLAHAADQRALPRLHADGTRMVDPSGKPVILRGCNLGNWLMIEPWMLGGTITAKDQGEITDILKQRFGEQRGYGLMETYRANYITPRDLELVKSFGFNCVRVPFDYRLMQDERAPFKMRDDAFKWIDRALELAEQAGLYVILDMHGVPAGQSNQHHTGRENQTPEIYDDPAAQQRFVDLWIAIAKRYKDRDIIAAYDVVNEPYTDYKRDITHVLRPLMFKVFEAIRATGDQHVILFPAALGKGVYFYGDVRGKGYKQFAFTDHYYPGLFGSPSTLASHAHVFRRDFVDVQKYLDEQQAPFLVGEFNVVLDRCGGELMMRKYYDEFARRGWMGTMWSYKLIKRDAGVQPDGWYMVTNADALPAIDIRNDSFETIESFFKSLATMPIAADEDLRNALTSSTAPTIELPAPIELPKSAPAAQSANGWTGVAIGNGGGGVEARDGRIVITARGSDIFGTSDNFYFVQRAVQSKQLITTRVASLLESGAYAKAGVMLRFGDPKDKSYASAPFVMVNVFPNGGVALLHRDRAGEPAKEIKRFPGPLPLHVGLQRDANRVTALASNDGDTWVTLGEVEISTATSAAQCGFAVASHSGSAFTRAEFTDVHFGEAKSLRFERSFRAAKERAGRPLGNWHSWGSMDLGANDASGFTFCGTGDSGLWQDVQVTPGKPHRFSVNVSRSADATLSRDAGFVELRLEATLAGKQVAIASREFNLADLESSDGASTLTIDGTPAHGTLRALVRIVPRVSTPVKLSFTTAAVREL